MWGLVLTGPTLTGHEHHIVEHRDGCEGELNSRLTMDASSSEGEGDATW